MAGHRQSASVAPDPLAVRYPRLTAGGILVNVAGALLFIAFLAPALWLISASLNSQASWNTAWPHFTAHNYTSLLNASDMKPFLNSLYLSVIATGVSTVLAVLAAYPLSRLWFPFKRTTMLGVLFISGLPILIVLVPTYEMFVQLGLINSLFWTGMFLAASSLPFAIWLMKNFIDGVPLELEEAARLEGAGTLRVLWRIIVPLTLPGIAVTSLLTFIAAWGSFVIPLILNLNPNDTPGAVALFQFQSATTGVRIGPLAAYCVLFSLPVLTLYLVAARQLRGSFTFAGGLRG
jgi:multiple sugar transport system permease protein